MARAMPLAIAIGPAMGPGGASSISATPKPSKRADEQLVLIANARRASGANLLTQGRPDYYGFTWQLVHLREVSVSSFSCNKYRRFIIMLQEIF